MNVKLSDGRIIPIDMHKVRVVQQTTLPPLSRRVEAIAEAGYNTFLLRTRDIFLDMLTDSGTNAMSDHQLAAMMISDDAYAGGESYYRLQQAVKDVLGFEYCLPVHQGRACEHLLARVFIKPGDVQLMNYHFTTTKAHFEMQGGKVVEIYCDDALQTASDNPFKGNLDLDKFRASIAEYGADRISFVRMEATTNLIGGQPFSMANLKAVREIAQKHNIPVIIDCSLISENAYMIKQREAEYADWSVADIVREMMAQADVIYMSGRKSTCARGGLLATNNPEYHRQFSEWLPVFEGFLTYGGMSSKEIEAMAVGLREMTDLEAASASVDLIAYLVDLMVKRGVPAVTPPGGLAGHVDAMKFCSHIPQTQYPAGALAAAFYIVSAVRGMERGTISSERDEHGQDILSDLELLRLAVPRRVYSMAHMEYVVDRLSWLYAHRDLIGGLEFVQEPPALRFFIGRLAPIGDWPQKLAEAYRADFGEV
ncbi:MAG: tryptophanase [Firmicutes bacterium]|jgi:tryptophanase|nr:tryptophanase [Bacillota bacterium]